MNLLTARKKILVDFQWEIPIPLSQKGGLDEPPKVFDDGEKEERRDQVKIERGYFIVGRRRHPRFSMEPPLDYAIETVEGRRVDFII